MKYLSFLFCAAVLTLLGVNASSLAQTSSLASNDQPAVIAAVAPAFPPIARVAHVKGDVVIEVEIGSDGIVMSSKGILGHPLVQKRAKSPQRNGSFHPLENEPDTFV